MNHTDKLVEIFVRCDDVISTGTPAGVGMGIQPNPVFLKEGDVMELGIEGLGGSGQYV